MLVLGRKEDETIQLHTREAIPAGTVIEIVLTKVHQAGHRAEIGIRAPDSVLILRGEMELAAALTASPD